MDTMHANPVEIIKKEIYIIKNDINNLVYIGQAINSAERFYQHCKKSSGKKAEENSIDKAIYNFGKEHFWFEVICPACEDYNQKEIELINQYNSMTPNGYNLMPGGEAPPRLIGEEHPNAKLSNNDVEEIVYLLENTKISLKAIADKYQVSKKQILRINQGKSRMIDGKEYPLRKEPNINGKLTEQQIDEIIDLLKHSYLFSGEIGKKYNVSEHIISKINSGETHHRDNEKYPIRNWKSCGTRAFTYDQVTEIIDRLKHDNISINKMAKEYGVNPSDIYNINSGISKKYRRDNVTYPIRPF